MPILQHAVMPASFNDLRELPLLQGKKIALAAHSNFIDNSRRKLMSVFKSGLAETETTATTRFGLVLRKFQK